MRRFLYLAFVAVFSAGMLGATSAQAMTGAWQEQPQASARLIAADNVLPGKLLAALDLKLADGWHAYWRSPGDAGLPPELNWSASENLVSATPMYPMPKLESLQGINTYGYSGELVLPLVIEKTDAAQGVKLAAKANILICADICVPVKYDLTLELPAGFTPSDEAVAQLKTALASVPKVDDGQGLSLQAAHVVDDNGKKAIKLDVTSPQKLGAVDVIAEVGDGSTLPIPSATAGDGFVMAALENGAPLADVAGKELTFTLADKTNGQYVEKKLVLDAVGAALTPAPADTAVVSTDSLPPNTMGSNLFAMILFALLGGLVLNLMPCVLPVLALKALSFIKHGGGTKSGVRLSFLSTSAGIIVSFAVMAGILIGIKNAGMSVGWGVQFQHPAFLIGLIAILLIFSANMWGLFEIALPRVFADRLSWTQGHGNLVKDFFAGVFATLLATPCSAPFLGTAVGFALAGKSSDIMVIFLSLGVGLALPYLLIALFPTAATLLPKPGKWMNNVRRLLSVALLVTAVWLGWVLLAQVGSPPAKDVAWQDFDQSKIMGLVQQNKTVFVDVTAEWCLTCKVNKKFVLGQADVRDMLAKDNIVLMRADWTKPNETIAAYLKEYGRFGIPFNIVYGPAQPQGVPLPELLSKQAVIDAIAKAEGL